MNIGTEYKEQTTHEKERILPENIKEAGSEMYAKTQQAASEAYDKTAKVVSDTYNQAATLGRENPEKMALIAFGVGFGLGVLFCSRESRASRSAHAVVDAVYDVAVAFLR